MWVPFPLGVWGNKWNSILLVPDRCRFIFFDTYVTIDVMFDQQSAKIKNNEAKYDQAGIHAKMFPTCMCTMNGQCLSYLINN